MREFTAYLLRLEAQLGRPLDDIDIRRALKRFGLRPEDQLRFPVGSGCRMSRHERMNERG